jgi:predicted membrane chloride channel (bestrophin family)
MLAEEVERPFDDLPNDLPLDSICESIHISVEQALGVRISGP